MNISTLPDLFTDVISRCPLLETCRTPEASVMTELLALLENGHASSCLPSQVLDQLNGAFKEYSKESDISNILKDTNAYLLEVEKSLSTTSITSTTNRPCKLLRLICNSWQASRTLKIKYTKLHLLIVYFCPSACNLTLEEIDQSWRILSDTYAHMFKEGVHHLTGEDTLGERIDSLQNANTDWIEVCIEETRNNREPIHTLLFITVRLLLICNKLLLSCQSLHRTYSSNSLEVLKSILEKCQSLENDFLLAEALIIMQPICSSMVQFYEDYTPDHITLVDAQQRAKHLQAQFLYETENLQNSSLNDKILQNASEVFCLSNGCSFNFTTFVSTVKIINERLDDVDAKLSAFLDALEFLILFDKLRNTLDQGCDFLSKYDCLMYEEYSVMKGYCKKIYSYFYSSHLIDQCHTEMIKLRNLFDAFSHEIDMHSEILDNLFLNSSIGHKMLECIDTEYHDFLQILDNVNKYYEEGCRELQSLSNERDNLFNKLQKRLNWTIPKQLKVSNFAELQTHQSNLKQEREDLKIFFTYIENIQTFSDNLCEKSAGEVQQHIQEKLQTLRELHFQISASVDCSIKECFNACDIVSDIEDLFIKIEEYIEAAKDRLDEKVREHSKGKYQGIAKFLKTRIDTLKKRTLKLGDVVGMLNQLKVEDMQYLDFYGLEIIFDCFRKDRENILVYLRNLLETEIREELKKCQNLMDFGYTNLISYQPYLNIFEEGDPKALEINYSEKLIEIENFFNKDLSLKLVNPIQILKEDCLYVIDAQIDENIQNFEGLYLKLELQQQSTKHLLNFVIIYNELEEKINSCRSFISSVDISELHYNLEHFCDQMKDNFNEGFFEQCSKCITNLFIVCQLYICEDTVPPHPPIPMPVIARKHDNIVTALKLLQVDYSQITSTMNECAACISEYNEQSKLIMMDISEFYQLLKQNERRSYSNSTELAKERQAWDTRIRNMENRLVEYEQCFLRSKSIVPLCKSEELKNEILPQAKKLFRNLTDCSQQIVTYENNLSDANNKFDTLESKFCRLYFEQKQLTSLESVESVNIHEEFANVQTKLNNFQTTVKDLRNNLVIIQGSCHGIIDDFSSQYNEINLLSNKISNWKSKIDLVIDELNPNVVTTNPLSNCLHEDTATAIIKSTHNSLISSVTQVECNHTYSLTSNITKPIDNTDKYANATMLANSHGYTPNENCLDTDLTRNDNNSNSIQLDLNAHRNNINQIEHCKQVFTDSINFCQNYVIPAGPHLEHEITFMAVTSEIDSKLVLCTTEVKSILEYNDNDEDFDDASKKACQELETILKQKHEELKFRLKEARNEWDQLKEDITSLEVSAKGSDAEIKLLLLELENTSLSEDDYFELEYRADNSKQNCSDSINQLQQINTESILHCACSELCSHWRNILNNIASLLRDQPGAFDRILAKINSKDDESHQEDTNNDNSITDAPILDTVLSNHVPNDPIIHTPRNHSSGCDQLGTPDNNDNSITDAPLFELDSIIQSTASSLTPPSSARDTLTSERSLPPNQVQNSFRGRLYYYTKSSSVSIVISASLLYVYSIYLHMIYMYQNPYPLNF